MEQSENRDGRRHEVYEVPDTSCDEARKMLALAAPSIVFLVSGFGIQTVAILFISRLGQLQLSAAALAISVCNTTGLSLIFGLASGMDTLCGQAFGAQNFPMIGIVMQRAILIDFCIVVPILLVWLHISPLLTALGQDARIADLAGKLLVWGSPQLLLTAVGVGVEKFQTSQAPVGREVSFGVTLGTMAHRPWQRTRTCCVQGCLHRVPERTLGTERGSANNDGLVTISIMQNIMNPVTIINMAVFLLCPLPFWFFTSYLGWGLFGAAMAIVCTDAITTASMVVSTVWILTRYKSTDPRKGAWPGFTFDAFKGWWGYLQYGGPACAMLCLEWWLFEIAAMLSGLLPDAQVSLAVMGIVVQIVSLAFMVPLGVSIALRIRVSNLLGAGDGMAAKRAVTTALLISWALVCVFLAIIIPFRYNISRMFMPFADPNSRQMSTLVDCILLVAAGAVGDWTNCTLAGALQGAGRQNTGAKIYAVTHWCIGTALLWLFAFHLGFGVRGIWAALAVVSNGQCFLMGFAVWTIDWDEEARLADERVGVHDENGEEGTSGTTALHAVEEGMPSTAGRIEDAEMLLGTVEEALIQN